MDFNLIVKTLTTALNNDLIRQGVIVGATVLSTGTYIVIKACAGKNKRKLLTITDLKKSSKRFTDLHYKQSLRGGKS